MTVTSLKIFAAKYPYSERVLRACVNNKYVYSVSGLILMLSMVSIFTCRLPAAYLIFVVAAAIMLIVNFPQLVEGAAEHRRILVAYMTILLLMLPFSLTRNTYAPLHFCVATLAVFLGIALTGNLRGYRNISAAALLMCQATLLFLVAGSWGQPFPLDEPFPTASSNNLTSTIIVLQLNYMAAQFALTGRTTILTAIVTLAICLVGYGRGSVGTALLIVFAHAVFPLQFTTRSIPKRLVALAAFAVGLVVALGQTTTVLAAIYSFATTSPILSSVGSTLSPLGAGLSPLKSYLASVVTEFTAVETGTKLALGIHDYARRDVLLDYIREMGISGWILGGSYQNTIIATEFHGNPHISYVRAHHLFGLPYLLMPLVMTGLLLWRLRNNKACLPLGFVAAVYLLRATTEPILFPTVYDTCFFALCLGLTTRQNLHLIGVSSAKPL